MTRSNPLITLNNDVRMPALGLGVYGTVGSDAPGIVAAAISCGYRLIDTATIYGNEAEVGRGIAQSGVDRSELFVQTKLWPTEFGYGPTLRGFEASLQRLGLDYVDLYLIHWPCPKRFDETVESYRAMERLHRDGRIRAIGVSNFSPAHLRDLMNRAEIVPAVNQLELHPFFNQRKLRDVHRQLGIVTQSWSPLGGDGGASGADGSSGHPLDHPTIAEIAAGYGKTPAQLILRWHLHHGLSVIPKSARRERLSENFDVFDFDLTDQDVTRIDALDTGERRGPDPETFHPSL